MDPVLGNANRRRLKLESDANRLNSTSTGPEVDLPNSPGLIVEGNISRHGRCNSHSDIHITHLGIEVPMESPLGQVRGTRLSVRPVDVDKQQKTMK